MFRPLEPLEFVLKLMGGAGGVHAWAATGRLVWEKGLRCCGGAGEARRKGGRGRLRITVRDVAREMLCRKHVCNSVCDGLIHSWLWRERERERENVYVCVFALFYLLSLSSSLFNPFFVLHCVIFFITSSSVLSLLSFPYFPFFSSPFLLFPSLPFLFVPFLSPPFPSLSFPSFP